MLSPLTSITLVLEYTIVRAWMMAAVSCGSWCVAHKMTTGCAAGLTHRSLIMDGTILCYVSLVWFTAAERCRSKYECLPQHENTCCILNSPLTRHQCAVSAMASLVQNTAGQDQSCILCTDLSLDKCLTYNTPAPAVDLRQRQASTLALSL